MNERAKFVLEAERREVPLGDLCERYGISRKTGYKWLARARQGGLAALADRSTRPGTSPAGLPEAPNDVWTVDFKGCWHAKDGRRCEPLTIRDLHSRYVLCADPVEKGRTRWMAIRQAFTAPVVAAVPQSLVRSVRRRRVLVGGGR